MLALAALLASVLIPATDSKPLEYIGKPMRLEFACSEEDMVSTGMSCSEEEPCPVYLELAAIEPVGLKLFVAGNIHSAQATLYSVLLASEDGGKTWREVSDRIRGASLDHIQFIDFETGWVSGQSLQPLPRDPFLLITTDGGKTWRQRPVFSESRGGAVQQFRFDSPSAGRLLIREGPHYELYESPNGGETWLVREVSERPIPWKQAVTSSSSSRVRADRASKSFRIERREGEKWTAVASFAIEIGTCKPAAVELKPPEEPAVEPSEPPPAPPRRPTRTPTLKKPD